MAMHKADVGHGIDEVSGLAEHAFPDRESPKRFRLLELLKDLNRFAYVNRSIRILVGGVAKFANARVPRASIVPCIGALLGKLVGDFVQLNPEIGLEPFKHRSKVCGHDPASDQDDVWVLNVGVVFHGAGRGTKILGKRAGAPAA